MMLSIALQLITPRFLRDIIDGIVGESTRKEIITWLVWFLVLVLAGELIRLVVTYLSNRVGWNATNWMRTELLDHCLRQTEESLRNFKAGSCWKSSMGMCKS